MTKRPQPSPRSAWDIYLARHTLAKWIGTVEAADANAAVEAPESLPPHTPRHMVFPPMAGEHRVPLSDRCPDCIHSFRVAAISKTTAAGSSSNATTRMNHRSTTSSAWPSRVARYRTGPRSASTVRRSPSTAAFLIFRSARAFASTVSSSSRLPDGPRSPASLQA